MTSTVQASNNDEQVNAHTNQDDAHMRLLQDTLVVVIGVGEKVWQLADQRVYEKGRLLVLITDSQPAGSYVEDTFTWSPPGRVKAVGEQGRAMEKKYKSTTARRWIRKGPDILELKGNEKYEIEEQGRGVRVLSDGQVVWEVSGKILLADKVTDPDTESLSVSIGHSCVWPVPESSGSIMLVCFTTLLMVGILANGYEKDDGPPYARAVLVALSHGCAAMTFMNTWWGAAGVGIDNNTMKASVSHWLSGFGISVFVTSSVVISSLSKSFSIFLASAISASLEFGINLPLYLYQVAVPGYPLKPGEKEPKRMRILGLYFAKPEYIVWALAHVNFSFGCWLQFYVVGIVYVMVINAGYDTLASVALPIVTASMESGFVAVMQVVYTKFVVNKRSGGNLNYSLSSLVCLLHCYAEGVKVASMVAGAVLCEDNPSGAKWPHDDGSCDPYNWVFSVCTGFVITLLARVGWTRYLFARLLQVLRLRKLKNFVAPSTTSKLHDEAKFCFGYSRFAVGFALILTNFVLGKDPVLFNVPATWCFGAALLVEAVEDIIIMREVIPYPPSPNPANYLNYGNNDPHQLYTFPTKHEEELASRRTSGWRSSTTPMALRTDGDYFPRALPLHGVRNMTLLEMQGIHVVGAFFSLCLFQLLLGPGYVAGVCNLPLTPEDRFKEAFLWPVPLNKCVY